MFAEEADQAGNGCISDDSSFYGDDDTKTELEQQSAAFSTRRYWSTHEQLLPTVVHKSRVNKPNTPQKCKVEDKQPAEQEETPNEQAEPPSAPNWYQPAETVDEFLQRLSLDTVMEQTGISWLWVQSPNSSSYNKIRPDEKAFCAQGEELLQSFLQKKAKIERDNPSILKGSVTSKLYKDRIKLKDDIEGLMIKTNMVCGKWMLRPPVVDAPRFWKQICLAVLDGRLGHAAKIATTSLTKSENVRMICVYTKDCFDTEDIKRVLHALTEMDLVSKDYSVYYKTNAYTNLQIYADNEYKLQASLCTSKNIWDLKAKKRKAEPQSPSSTWKGKRPALGNFFASR